VDITDSSGFFHFFLYQILLVKKPENELFVFSYPLLTSLSPSSITAGFPSQAVTYLRLSSQPASSPAVKIPNTFSPPHTLPHL